MRSGSDAHAPTTPVVITPGEPAGIGPELVVQWFVGRSGGIPGRSHPAATPVVLADAGLMQAVAAARAPGLRVHRVGSDTFEELQADALNVRHVPLAAPVVAGAPAAANGPYVLECLDRAVAACLAGRAAALVTGPVQKSTVAVHAPTFRGHTEYLAERCGIDRVVMLLCVDALRVALVTTHLPLRAVPDAITAQALRETLDVLYSDLQHRFGCRAPRILVAGLNPHAGDDGLLGHEDAAVIAPVCAAQRAAGRDVVGPLPADTLFLPGQLAGADAVLAMYHDQGLPVIKHLGFDRAVNVTLGLPIVRTSVDHGTALDLVGTGRADTGSLAAAWQLACRLGSRIADSAVGMNTP